MRVKIDLNNNWQYTKAYKEGMENSDSLSGFELVNIPHSNIELPYNYFDEKLFQFVSCYKLPFTIGSLYKGQLAVIRFEAVMTYAKVYMNGQYIGEHKGGYTPFEFDVTDAIKYDGENILTVIVDSTEREDIPPFGGQIDYLTYGGIYREVSISFYDKIYINNTKVETYDIYADLKSMKLDLHINNQLSEGKQCELDIEITDSKNNVIHRKQAELNLDPSVDVYIVEVNDIKDIHLWSIDSPNLYGVKIRLKADDYEDEYITRVGFRDCDFRADGFYLNNERVNIVGLNRHQSYAYNGYAMPKRVQEKDAELLKNDLHVNTVRTSHYPQSIHFLNKCDELGLLVFEEIPGWQHIGNEAWKEVAVENVREMIERDWNHPSIIIWGVRINESLDDDDFYKKTNDLAKKLDSTRQTGGVRYIDNSNLLEDVYTMNDFVLDGGDTALREQQDVTGLGKDVPYLVTEYNGHMYPTKKFDQEERQMEHVTRHLRVQNASGLSNNISGAIGWCMFDYNTHKDFGAGDRICYHGVMDIFRDKKFGAYVYKSQVSPSIEPVLKPVTFWARGERSIGGILPLIVLTNCEYIELAYGGFEPTKFYPAKGEYKGLKYPPIIVRLEDIDPSQMGEWGMKWEDCQIKGFVNGEEVANVKMAKDPIPTTLSVVVDDNALNASEKDATRIMVKALDQYGNTMPFIDEIIDVELEGVGRIIGPNRFVLTGGSRGFYVETVNQAGDIDIVIKSTLFDDKVIKVSVK